MAEMVENDVKLASSAQCPATRVFDLIAHKWTMAIIATLHVADEPVRFGQLQRAVGAMTAQELTKRLRELERSGMATRTIYAELPPRVEYALTRLGATLIPALVGPRDWASLYADQIDRIRQEFDRKPQHDPAPVRMNSLGERTWHQVP